MTLSALGLAAVVGPTAVGKSELAVEVAERLDAEIVSCDSMQAYRGLDIGTDKPSGELRARVRHHMIDVFDPDRDVTVVEFRARARAAIDAIAQRRRTPLLVGGSGLYFRAVVDDMRFREQAPEIRARLEAEAAAVGARALHDRLAALDPEAAGRIEPANARRTVRALEVIAASDRAFSEGYDWSSYRSVYHPYIAGLFRERRALYERIEQRVDAMLERGLVAETRALARRGMGATARQAVGYRQVLELPVAGQQELRAEIIRATKRLARRQESWFRADPRVVWFDASKTDVAADVARFAAAAKR